MRVRTWHGILFLSLLALLSWQLSRRQSETETAPVGPPDVRLNYALYDFKGRLLDERGQVPNGPAGTGILDERWTAA